MDTDAYLNVLNDAFARLEGLHQKRDSIDAETMKLKQLITATANMLPDDVRALVMRRLELLQELVRVREVGLTEACRVILKAAHNEWLTVTNVRDRLVTTGFNFSNYTTNPLASISTTLRRMRPEEVESKTIDGVAAYRWKDTTQSQVKLGPMMTVLADAIRKSKSSKQQLVPASETRGFGDPPVRKGT